MIYAIAVIFLLSFFVASYQKNRGLNFWTSFFMSIIAFTGVSALIWKILN